MLLVLCSHHSASPTLLFEITRKGTDNDLIAIISSCNFNFQSHISAICGACFYHIHLDLNGAKLLANALASSRLNYCNSLLSGIADTDLAKPQRVQNRLARVVTKSPPLTRSVPLLRSCRWLPAKFELIS